MDFIESKDYSLLGEIVGWTSVSVLLLPGAPTKGFVREFQMIQKDPNFLDNIFPEIRVFDDKTQTFGNPGGFYWDVQEDEDYMTEEEWKDCMEQMDELCEEDPDQVW